MNASDKVFHPKFLEIFAKFDTCTEFKLCSVVLLNKNLD